MVSNLEYNSSIKENTHGVEKSKYRVAKKTEIR